MGGGSVGNLLWTLRLKSDSAHYKFFPFVGDLMDTRHTDLVRRRPWIGRGLPMAQPPPRALQNVADFPRGFPNLAPASWSAVVGEALCRFRMPDERSSSAPPPHPLEKRRIRCAPSCTLYGSVTSSRATPGVEAPARGHLEKAMQTRSDTLGGRSSRTAFDPGTGSDLTSPAASSFTPDLSPLPSPGSGVKGAGKR
jgi:hypothetical protein